MGSPDRQPQVSIVLPAHNSEKTIGQTLTALMSQVCPIPSEIIVVDDGSVDKTTNIVHGFPNVKYHYRINEGPAAARNFGASQARGNLVFFIDADCVPQRDWLAKMLSFEDEPKLAAITGSYGIANPENLLASCIHQEIMFRHKALARQRQIKVFGSYNVWIKRDIFNAVGRFNTKFRNPSGEDNDLSYRIVKTGYKILFKKDALVDHYHPERLTKYLKTQFMHGFWRAKLYRDHPAMMAGDTYTFWKDILEPLLVLLLFPAVPLAIRWPMMFAKLEAGLLILFLGLEMTFGFVITGHVPSGLFLSLVMFLRAFARTFGMIWGVCFFVFRDRLPPGKYRPS